MSVSKRGKSEHYHYSFRFKRRRFRGSTRTSEKSAAERIEAKIRLEVAEQEHFPKQREMTLAEAFLKYLDHAEHLPSYYTIDRQIDTLGAIDGALRLSAVTDSIVSDYVARRRGQKARNRKALISPATVNRELQTLRAVMNKARDEWQVSVAPVKWLKHRLQEAPQRRRYLSGDEQDAFLTHLREDMRPLVKFCLLTGARLMSAIRLTWKDVDYQSESITFRKFKGGEHHTIPLSREAKILLANEKGKHAIYCFAYKCIRYSKKRVPGNYYPFSKDGWRKTWAAALKDAKIENFRFHDQRHTALSRVTKEAGIAVARKLAGHTSIMTTSRYAHVLMDDVKSAMDKSVHKSGHLEKPKVSKTRRNKG